MNFAEAEYVMTHMRESILTLTEVREKLLLRKLAPRKRSSDVSESIAGIVMAIRFRLGGRNDERGGRNDERGGGVAGMASGEVE